MACPFIQVVSWVNNISWVTCDLKQILFLSKIGSRSIATREIFRHWCKGCISFSPSRVQFLTRSSPSNCFQIILVIYSPGRNVICTMTRASTAAPIVPQPPKTTIPSYLVAFPSFSHSLHSLTSATNVEHLHLHASSFSRHPQHSEAKVQACILSINNDTHNPDHQLKAALDRNLAVAQQKQEEERQRHLIEMENAARLRILEAQEGQVRLGLFSEYDDLVIVIVIRSRTILNLHLLSL